MIMGQNSTWIQPYFVISKFKLKSSCSDEHDPLGEHSGELRNNLEFPHLRWISSIHQSDDQNTNPAEFISR